ncbi:MAG: RdgB/HAM1 family non-canonical purine NTP pyrophosphatase [Candidatus Promineofilum sp.]|nr:RdgB/HAM1 family non-canonical purine NTP pyrophosphatase [Promineifilum sp.]
MVKIHAPRLLVATHNKGKLGEYIDILTERWSDLLTLDEADIVEDVPETGSTFLENATLKAVAYSRQANLYTLADDSGLEVDALGGRPGVLTARFGGPGLSPADRYRLLLAALAGVPDAQRGARFRCAIVLAGPDGTILGTAEGVCEGVIALAPSGMGGFGYDPIFYLPDHGLTMAELPAVEKHLISHRGRAVRAIQPLLEQLWTGSASTGGN